MKAILLYVFVCLNSAVLWAQSVAGSGVVSGTVFESGSEGMPDAEVILENRTMGVRRVILTTVDGHFEAAGVVPAPGYRLSITREGFRSWESGEFEVPAGQRVTFEVSLAARNPAEGGHHGGALPLVDRTTDSVAVMRARQIETLPAAKRRWENLLLLAPAVSASHPADTPAIRGDAALNAYFIDGLPANNSYPASRAAPAARIAQDAVQGFEVLAAGAPAEFGHALGGIVNTVTRSGGRGLHGDLYEYFGNHSLSAVDRYALGHNLLRERNQGGLNLGGGIPGSKVFFFTNLEFLDTQGQGLNRITNPLVADSAGTSVAGSNCKATAAQCASASRFIERQMNVLVPRAEHWVTGLAKLDYRRSERHTLNLAAYLTRSRSPLGLENQAVAPNGGLLGNAVSRREANWGKLEWVSALAPNAGNELRLGMFQDEISNTASKSGLSTGNLSLSIAGVTVGESQPAPGVLTDRRFQLVDNLRVSFGAHTFTIGVDWTRTGYWVDKLANRGGTYYYSSLTAFAQDLAGAGRKNYSWFTQTFGTSARSLHSKEVAFYAQDTWKVTPRLWATGGVRWSKQYLPQPTEANSTYYQTGIVNSSNTNADPRIGLSYLAGDRTVLRISFGMFHAAHPGEILDALFLGNGVYQTSIQVSPAQTGAPSFPSLVSSKSIPTGSVNLMYASTKLRNPYARQTTVALERYLGGGLTLSASYIGSRGLRLWTAEERNLVDPEDIATYTINGADGKQAGTFYTLVWSDRSNTSYGHIFEVGNAGSSWYRALALQLRKRMARGFSAQASYTWSHAIDDLGGGRLSGAIAWNSYNSDHRRDLGSSATDQRHRAVFDWVWQPRLVKSPFPAARYLLNGWEISSIATLASSQPSTALVVVNGVQSSSITMAFPGSLNGLGGWSRVPFLPVNHLDAGPEYTVNARLGRDIPFSERVVGKLVFEAFNLFNTQFNTSLNTIAYVATGGVLTPVSGLGSGNSSQGHPNGTNARSCQVALRLTF